MGRQVTELRLPYIHAFRDRHGMMRYYVRRKGKKRVRLFGPPGSDKFMGGYHAALKDDQEPKPKGGPRSLSDLIQTFYRSAEFQNLSASTKEQYRYILSKIEAKDGHRSAIDLPEEKARKIIEEIGETRPALANLTCSVLRRLFAHAIKPLRWRHSNPFAGITRYEIGSHHTWTDQEIEAYEKYWPLGTRERTAFDLLLYTAQRIGDVVRMKRTDIARGVLSVKQEKTGTALKIPVHPALQRSLNAYGIRGQHLVGRKNGGPIKDDNLSMVVWSAGKAAGLPGKCVPHGIRKAALRILAERGMSAKVIASLSGHKTLREIERYTEAADQETLAGQAVANLHRKKWQT